MIETKYTDKTLEGDSQECSIYKLADEDNWHISCTIPKLARKWESRLISGFRVINKVSGQVVEIHGIVDGNVIVSKKPELTEEQKEMYRENIKRIRKSTDD